MKRGDLVIVPNDALPCRELGQWGGSRMPPPSGPGLVLELDDFWGELWGKVLFPEGIGWVNAGWVEILQ